MFGSSLFHSFIAYEKKGVFEVFSPAMKYMESVTLSESISHLQK